MYGIREILVLATLHLDCLVVNQPPAVHTVYKILVIQLLACDWLIVLFLCMPAIVTRFSENSGIN